MLAAARMNARNPTIPFQPDVQAKIAMATPELRALTHQWLDDIYQQLESGRRSHGFAGQTRINHLALLDCAVESIRLRNQSLTTQSTTR